MCCAIKFVLYIFNVMFWLIGGTLLGLGIWMVADPNALDSLDALSGMDDNVLAAAVYTMIVIGGLLFLVGGLGCCAANGSKVFLYLYITFVSIVLVCEIVVVVLIAVFWNSLTEDIRDSMYRDVTEKYSRKDQSVLTKSWDSMQKNWECCGSNNYTDYKDSVYNNNNPIIWTVPSSCCRKSDDFYYECQLEIIANSKDYLFTKGCYEGLVDWLDYNAPILIGVTCGFIAIQIVGLIASAYTLHKRNKDGKFV